MKILQLRFENKVPVSIYLQAPTNHFVIIFCPGTNILMRSIAGFLYSVYPVYRITQTGGQGGQNSLACENNERFISAQLPLWIISANKKSPWWKKACGLWEGEIEIGQSSQWGHVTRLDQSEASTGVTWSVLTNQNAWRDHEVSLLDRIPPGERLRSSQSQYTLSYRNDKGRQQ